MEDNRNFGESDPIPDNQDDDVPRTPDNVNSENSHPHTGDGASPGKIFIGGLARETTSDQFIKYFGKYGEITDSVIMKDRSTGQPRGFGFVTYADSSVVDRVIEETHIINGKQVEIKRTIPRGANSKDFKTKKIFVGGIPTTVDDDEFRDFFSNFGESVDDLLAKGNRLDFSGTQVEIKKAEPKKTNLPPPPSRRPSNSRAPFGGGHRETYGGYDGGGYGGGGGFGSSSFRSSGGVYGSRASEYGGYGGGPEFHAYGRYGVPGYGGGLRMESPLGYSSHFGGGFGRGYDVGSEYGGPADRYAGYGGAGYGGGYDAGFGDSYGSGRGGSVYGHRGGGYGGGGGGGGSGRYHPYGR
ncbi:heterogeneous nuclear ribonucleoprotein 1-like [Salvia divinorum]|uniref:Heterogeneous nuclear ribonucleoprotein 1-like n=1 Tax=Salvia divinorum TaxID=28513 RepID=A0ABD1FIC6_SALDI